MIHSVYYFQPVPSALLLPLAEVSNTPRTLIMKYAGLTSQSTPIGTQYILNTSAKGQVSRTVLKDLVIGIAVICTYFGTAEIQKLPKSYNIGGQSLIVGCEGVGYMLAHILSNLQYPKHNYDTPTPTTPTHTH